jgi:hypothetical protein
MSLSSCLECFMGVLGQNRLKNWFFGRKNFSFDFLVDGN